MGSLDGRVVIMSYGARFVAQVWRGDSLTARAVVEPVVEQEVGLTGTAVVNLQHLTDEGEPDVHSG